jgi:hypothetical protein
MKIIGNEKVYPVNDARNPSGLTIRQQFAMEAMNGILSTNQGLDTPLDVVRKSVNYADALINELNK